jgi:hypothetical protein
MSAPYPFIPNGPLIPNDVKQSAAVLTKNVVADQNLTAKGDVKLGTTAANKLGFFGTAGVVQPTSASVTDYASLKVALQNMGLIGL